MMIIITIHNCDTVYSVYFTDHTGIVEFDTSVGTDLAHYLPHGLSPTTAATNTTDIVVGVVYIVIDGD